MIRVLMIAGIVSTVVGCKSPVDPSTPKGAFAMLAPCVDKQDRACIFPLLDRDSRWSIATIHRTLTEMRGLVEKSYPEGRKDEAYGTWIGESKAKDAQAVFAGYCRRHGCLKTVTSGFGAVMKVMEKGPDLVEIETSRKVRFRMRKADGRWGIDLNSTGLMAEKIRLLDRIKQVRENAVIFDEQRVANGETQK